MSKERVYSQEVKDAFDRLTDAFGEIEFTGITILTGSNGSGKSMIRKQFGFALARELDIDGKEAHRLVMSTSMDARTGSNPEMGALSGMMRDTEWIATSQDTLSNLDGLFKAAKKEKGKYLIIDEFEIGCGEETTLALALFINKKLKPLIKNGNLRGATIITHSRIGVENIDCDNFINIDGLNKDEWLNREITPTDLVKLEENELFFYIRDKNNE